MSQPFIFIGTHRLKKGKQDAFRQSCEELVDLVEASEPRLIAFNLYIDESGSEVSVVQVHPDAESMLFHMKLAREHIEQSADAFETTTAVQVFGPANDAVLEMIKELSVSGVPISVKPEGLGGFTRSAAEQDLAASGSSRKTQ
jgi:quinol monooxygenase YgiN